MKTKDFLLIICLLVANLLMIQPFSILSKNEVRAEFNLVDSGNKGLDSFSNMASSLLSTPMNYAWHTFYGSNNRDECYAIAVGPDGSIYMAGTSWASWQGDGGVNPKHPFTGGETDIFVLKLSSSGVYQWHTFYGSSAAEYARGIVLGSDGSVYVTGYTGGSWLVDGNAAPKHSYSGPNDIFVLKLNSNGAYQWHTFYGSTDSEGGMGIALDKDDNVYVAGFSWAGWSGDGGASPKHPYSAAADRHTDITVLKLNSNGVYQWHTFYGSGGSVNDDQAYGIAVSNDGGVYVVGESYVTWKGDGATDPKHPHSGHNMDLFVLKLNSNGVYQWHTFYGGDYSDSGRAVAVGPDGSVYVTGLTSSNWLGDGNAPPRHSFTGTIASEDIVVLKLDKYGVYKWHTFFGSSDYDRGYGIAIGGDGGVYVAGSSWNWVGDGGKPPLHPNGGGKDMTLLELDENGLYQWHIFYGGTGNDEGFALGMATNGSIFMAGHSGANWRGDGNSEPRHPYSGGLTDITVLKLGQVFKTNLPIIHR